MDAKDFLLQKDWHEQKLEKLGTENWVTVYESTRSEQEHLIIYSALIPENIAEKILKTTDWEYQIGDGRPSVVVYYEDGKETETYEHFTQPNSIQPLVLVREFAGIYENYTEILEEFRLFHDLYHDQKRNVLLQFTEDGNEEEVARIKDKIVQIRLKWIKQFLAFKHMRLALYFDVLRHSTLELEDKDLKDGRSEHRTSNMCYSFAIRKNDFSWRSNRNSLSILHGKKLIEPMPKEPTGIFPYEKERQYETFVIGTDEHGEEITFSCNPENLANFFGKNPNNPFYLTPVFFRKAVLNRYYSNPDKYEVRDGYITLQGYWGLRADTNHQDYVIVYLGDLASLPYTEQQYWKGQNIVPDGTISDTAYRRGILGEFADPENPVFIFKFTYEQFQKKWSSRFSWNLFKSLSEADSYLFTALRIPLDDSYSEFDGQILALTKTLIDSLNEREVGKLITELEDGTRGISKFEAFLKQENVEDVEKIITFMRQLQKIRSASSAHRKGSDFENRMQKMGLNISSLANEFQNLIVQATQMLEILERHFLSDSET